MISKLTILQRLFTLIYGAGCVLGCAIQIHSITQSYMSFGIQTQVKVELPPRLKIPSMSVCFRIIDIFDYDAYMNEMRRRHNTTIDLIDTETLQSRITIADVFRFCPNLRKGNLFHTCIYRKPGSYDFHDINGTECHRMFDIKNFFLQEYLCYLINFTTYAGNEYHYRSVAFALTHPGLIYSVVFNISSFPRVQFVKMILNENDQRPLRSAAFTSTVTRFYNSETGDGRYNWFTMTYFLVKSTLLPKPYPTECVDWREFGHLDSEDCTQKCLVKHSLEKFGRYPYVAYVDQPIDHPILTRQHLLNASVNRFLYRFEKWCTNRCRQLGCKLSYTITRVTRDPDNEVLTFNILVPQLPNYIITNYPRLPLIEYFIYVLSCFGTWFGLSVLSLNPFRYQEWIKDTIAIIGHHHHPILENVTSFDGGTYGIKRVKRNPIQVRAEQAYHRSCVYCIQSRVLLLNEVKERLNMVQVLLNNNRTKSK